MELNWFSMHTICDYSSIMQIMHSSDLDTKKYFIRIKLYSMAIVYIYYADESIWNVFVFGSEYCWLVTWLFFDNAVVTVAVAVFAHHYFQAIASPMCA